MLLSLLFAAALSPAAPAANPPGGSGQVAGRARISCTVTVEGRLIGCAVVSEEPAGKGLGQAALRMSKLFKMKPTTRDGASVAGAKIIVPIAFKLAPDAPAAPASPEAPNGE